jgi:DNA-binding IclR family transcriptional regulator
MSAVVASTPGVPRNQSLKRAVAILRTLSERSEPATTTEIALAVGLARATAARMLATLADAGLAERPRAGDGWILGYEATRLGRAADPFGRLIRRAQVPLEELCTASGESAVLAVTRLPLDIEIVSQIDAGNLLGVASWVGRRFGLHASASGKLAYARLPAEQRDQLLEEQSFERYTPHTIVSAKRFAAELDDVRARGYAQSIDELELGLSMVGVDVPGQGSRSAVASVGVMGPTSRILPRLDDAVAVARAAATRIAEIEW